MGGRVSQLAIELWSVEELRFIAERGCEALSIDDRHGVGTTLAENSFGAPFLMQDLCYQYAVSLGVLQTAEEPVAPSSRRAGMSSSAGSRTEPSRSSSTTC